MNSNQEVRIRRSSPDEANQDIDQEILEIISKYGCGSMEGCSDEVNKELDIEAC